MAIGIHARPGVTIILFRPEIIHEGGQWVCLSSSLSSHPSSPGRCLSYHLLLGNNQEIYPVVCFSFSFSKDAIRACCPEQEKDSTIGISQSVCITLTFKQSLSVETDRRTVSWTEGRWRRLGHLWHRPWCQGGEWHVRHLIAVGLRVHGASVPLCGVRSPAHQRAADPSSDLMFQLSSSMALQEQEEVQMSAAGSWEAGGEKEYQFKR